MKPIILALTLAAVLPWSARAAEYRQVLTLRSTRRPAARGRARASGSTIHIKVDHEH